MRLSAENINKQSPYWVIQLDVEIDFGQCVVYSGMIIRNDHPQKEDMLAAFDEFISRAPSLYDVQPKP